MIAEQEVDLWLLDLREVDQALLDRYGKLLADSEHVQERRLRFPGGRERYRSTRALVRTTLSHYTGHDPRVWEFQTNNHGKPAVARPSGVDLQFNLSHSGRWVLCAVTKAGEVGVDVEAVREVPKAMELARRFFSSAEAAALSNVPVEDRHLAFLRYWTLKESYVKACGVGLLMPLEEFWFDLPAEHPPAICFAESGSDDPAQWQFAELSRPGEYQAALGIHRAQDAPLRVSVRKVVPFRAAGDGIVLPENGLRRWQV